MINSLEFKGFPLTLFEYFFNKTDVECVRWEEIKDDTTINKIRF